MDLVDVVGGICATGKQPASHRGAESQQRRTGGHSIVSATWNLYDCGSLFQNIALALLYVPQIRCREAKLRQWGAYVLFRFLLPRRRPYSRQDDDVLREGTTQMSITMLLSPQ